MTNPAILTISGEYFNFLHPEQSKFTIEDIAYGLSHACRFAGQVRSFYSVAQHSVLVSHAVPPEYARGALLHDASEAFIHDITKPLKNLLPDYQVIEARVQAATNARFNVDPEYPKIKEADLRALVTERRDLRSEGTVNRGIVPFEDVIKPWGPVRARQEFLTRFYELFP